MALWKWQSLPPQNLQEVLKQLTYVDYKEIVRFLPETFDALFSLLEVEGKNGVELPSLQCHCIFNSLSY